MVEKAAETAKNAERCTVDKLQIQMKVSDAVHTGTCALTGWCTGKEVTKKEYAAAVEQFKGTTTAGRRKNA